MTLQVVWTPYGKPALEALRDRIDRIKEEGNDPFLPVTVVVARGQVGLGVRRALAGSVSSAGRQGIANVTFVTLDTLADTLGGRSLVRADRLPLTDAVLRASVRSVLRATSPVLLGPAGGHASTIDALCTTYREMRTVDAAALARLADQSTRAAEVVTVLHGVRAQLAGWFDTVDVLEAATAGLASGESSVTATGSVLLYLPQTLTPPATRCIRALAARVPCTVLAGQTGDSEVDTETQHMITALLPDDEGPPAADVLVPVGQAVLSAPTVDAELLAVLRDLLTRTAAGTPPERMAIVHAGSPQYVTMLHTMLREAGIPFNGSGVRPLSSTVAGRMLLGALALPEHNWMRDEVAEWLNTGPIRHGGRTIPGTLWDVVSADAGVTEGVLEWRRQLTKKAHSLRAEADDGLDDFEVGEAWRDARRRQADRCEELLAFLELMVARLEGCPTGWPAWAAWAKELLHQLVGGTRALEQWPGEERAAEGAVEEALERLSVLAQLPSVFSPAAAKAALEAELAVPAPPTTRFGAGVWVAPLSAVGGLTLDVLYVVGMNDGIFPGRPADDVLLPDRERTASEHGQDIPLRSGRAVAMRRDYLAALAGADTTRLSYPRGNQRDGRELRPSRWALDAIADVTQFEGRLYNRAIEDVTPNDAYRKEASYMTAMASPGDPVSLADRDLRSLLVWTRSGRRLADHPLCHADVRLERGVEVVTERRAGFTRFNGALGLGAAGGTLVPEVLSATRLERFAECPRRYFFESVLKVEPRPVSERLEGTDRMEFGLLVHRILHDFVAGQIADASEAATDEARLMAIAGAALAAFEDNGLAGPRAAWQFERTRLLRELRTFATLDRDRLAREGLVATAVELSFGHADHEGEGPVLVDVPGRQPVRFRGTIDRVDVSRDGSRTVVTDYKTGSPKKFADIESAHFRDGKAVQLPIYAVAVGAGEGREVRADYWCVSEKGGFEPYGFRVDGDVVAELGRVVGILTDTMGAGHFPANPGEGGEDGARSGPCTYCPYDVVCPKDRHRVWERVKDDGALQGYVRLVAPA